MQLAVAGRGHVEVCEESPLPECVLSQFGVQGAAGGAQCEDLRHAQQVDNPL